MIKYLYTLLFAFCMVCNSNAQDSCTYVGNDFEVFVDLTEDIVGPGSGIPAGTLTAPEAHTSIIRLLTMTFASFVFPMGSPEWLEIWSAGLGLAPNTMASTGNTSLQIGGDASVSGADIYSVNYCNIIPDSITMDIKHIGQGADTLTVFMYQDSTVTPLPQDSAQFSSYASYSNFSLIAQGTENDFRQITIPVIGTGNIPEADTMMMLIFVSGNEAFLAGGEVSHFLIDNIQIRNGVQAIDNDLDGFTDDVDCDDDNPNVNPDAFEIVYNGIDDDCDPTTLDDDLDMDGFALADDCDDMNANINPDVMEVPYNGIDDDCDSLTLDDDLDMDGFAMVDDCDDMNANVNPDVMEVPYNGIDDDCDSLTLDDDLDMDGFAMVDDCDDMNAGINPDTMEIPYNGIDDDCDSLTLDDDLDMDGFAMVDDCDDMNAGINPDATEIPDNNIDEDCDGIDGTSSTDDLLFKSIKIAPNPVKDLFTIKTGFNIDRIRIFKTDGQLIYNSKVQSDSHTIHAQSFDQGILVIRLSTENGLTFQKKLLKI